MYHVLEILPEYFEDVLRYRKTFLLSKHDREYMVGNILILREWDGKRYTGRELEREITYIITDDNEHLIKGSLVLGIG